MLFTITTISPSRWLRISHPFISSLVSLKPPFHLQVSFHICLCIHIYNWRIFALSNHVSLLNCGEFVGYRWNWVGELSRWCLFTPRLLRLCWLLCWPLRLANGARFRKVILFTTSVFAWNYYLNVMCIDFDMLCFLLCMYNVLEYSICAWFCLKWLENTKWYSIYWNYGLAEKFIDCQFSGAGLDDLYLYGVFES